MAIPMTMGHMGEKEKDTEQAGYAWRVWVKSVEEFPPFFQFLSLKILTARRLQSLKWKVKDFSPRGVKSVPFLLLPWLCYGYWELFYCWDYLEKPVLTTHCPWTPVDGRERRNERKEVTGEPIEKGPVLPTSLRSDKVDASIWDFPSGNLEGADPQWGTMLVRLLQDGEEHGCS